MAKGENLEKPKKSGMVIVIGVGAKPKKDKSSMKKAERSHRNKITSFRHKMRKDPNYLEQALGKRMKGMDRDFFEKYLDQVKGTSVEEAMQNKMYDFPQAIHEAAEAYSKFKGRYELRGDTKQTLNDLGIDQSDFQQAAKERPFDSFSDLIRDLRNQPRETRSERRPRSERQPRRRSAVTDYFGDDLDTGSMDQMHEFRTRDMYGGQDPGDPSTPHPEERSESNQEDDYMRLLQLFEARGDDNPEEAAFNALTGGGIATGGKTSAEERAERTRRDATARSLGGDVYFQPSTQDTLPFAGAGTIDRRSSNRIGLEGRRGGSLMGEGSVESNLYGFRGAQPVRGQPKEDEEADLDAVQDLMMTGEPMNVMDAAWALLKADARQVYDDTRQLARQTMNPNVATMADRENKRRYEEHMKKFPKGRRLEGELTSPPPVRIELMGRPRNEHSQAAVKVGSRNYPTEGGPENETKLGPYRTARFPEPEGY